MKNILLLILAIIVFSSSLRAQSVDEIIDSYFEVTGGKENWQKLEGMKLSLVQKMQGMDIPVEILRLKGGRQYIRFELQGNQYAQNVYDGEVLWNTNFMSLESEKADSEALQNFLAKANDFPDPLLHYKENGYTAELLGSEEIEGLDCHKIKLTKTPIVQGGEEKDNIEFFYIDKDSGLLVATEGDQEGPQGSMFIRTVFGEYEEVGGLVFPYSMASSYQGQAMMEMSVETIDLDPEYRDEDFKFVEK